jgi:DNA-binding PadR family transcriptional regulator
LTSRDYSCESSRVSSIRLFVLGSLAKHGAMHGHQLRLLAEEEHVTLWTDITVGAVYGAIKRLATEGLIEEVRIEREGKYPERQVYAISRDGRRALSTLRSDGLRQLSLKPDPFDLALTRLDPDKLDDLTAVIHDRLLALQSLLRDTESLVADALPYLTVSERYAISHKEHRLRAEIDWHEDLLKAVPEIVADESARKGV